MKDFALGSPITGITGINGSGKTLLAVESAISDMQTGRTVYSTVPISSKYGDSLPVTSLHQLATLRDCTILLDEVAVIFSSRATAGLPHEVVTLLQTLRHKNIRVLWTAPAWMRADNLLREVTQALVSVSPLFRGSPSRNNPWPRPRVVMAGLLDTSSGKTDSEPDKVLRRRLFIPTRMVSYGAYDSMADTPQLGVTKHNRLCECGGAVPAPKHTEERHRELGIPWSES
jgi:hypothetical protein